MLSESMFRHNEEVFLDDMSLEDVERELKVKAYIVPNDGYELYDALLR